MIGSTISVVGQEGMPEPASRPRGPKLKFSAQEDQMLVDLKENKNLTWKQIADFFPGRTSGTLQVRYCTKLKAKTVIWTDETVTILFR
jgi:Myb-like DNA-binding domain